MLDFARFTHLGSEHRRCYVWDTAVAHWHPDWALDLYESLPRILISYTIQDEEDLHYEQVRFFRLILPHLPPFCRNSDDGVNELADKLEDVRITERASEGRRRNPMAIYCVAEVREKDKPPRKCGERVQIGADKCDKEKWPHQTCWDNVSCSYCHEYIRVHEPWYLSSCPGCAERLHGGEMSRDSLGLH